MKRAPLDKQHENGSAAHFADRDDLPAELPAELEPPEDECAREPPKPPGGSGTVS